MGAIAVQKKLKVQTQKLKVQADVFSLLMTHNVTFWETWKV